MRRIAAGALVLMGMSTGSAFAQQCLHGAGESADQALRRKEALTATRTLNNIQVNRGNRQAYFRQDELAAAPAAQKMKASSDATTQKISLDPLGDILPGWKLTLDLTEKGYWFMIKDKTDPCGFAFVSTQEGLIYTAQPLQ